MATRILMTPGQCQRKFETFGLVLLDAYLWASNPQPINLFFAARGHILKLHILTTYLLTYLLTCLLTYLLTYLLNYLFLGAQSLL